VNGDGQVNIQDLVAVAAAFGEAAAAPAAHAAATEHLTATEVQQWLHAAQNENLTDPDFQRGVEVLKHLLTRLTPKETVLLPNYPNPFNPETWIPYQLAEPAEVTIRIYAVDGSLVRTLSLGHQATGSYQSRTRAAYWDGRNNQGEPVASGVYFYTLTAGDFTSTRKMLIRK
ncbi:T9SS type A sorting domain-containing protein, partial [Candidatus Poribacteria bacterium]|nr:T9SS type A sorting domain-containing protein [Candidatus Poribacteria bacterium]